ncbi:metallophosphoesterase [Jiangella anatolica]|uniref:metallophosphoesterase n=1 Tax=Jiangella anatolica TaxID=2670374 RepID=UPI0011B471BC|nr:metallophosphoesterase [Jiangella anatolica]
MTQSARPGHRKRVAGLAAAVLAVVLVGATWPASYAADVAEADAQPEGPEAASEPPTLTPADGAYLEGTVTVASEAVTADDDVTSLTVDGQPVPGATPTVGVSTLSFDVGSNSTEARYHNHVLINGTHRIDLADAVNERVSLEVPNEHLVPGENTVEVVAGTVTTSCGVNHDDFALSDFTLELLGGAADGEANEYNYSFGDGSCGSNTSLLLRATLTFVIDGDPQGTTGLAAELDTTTLANGPHEIVARTISGAATTHTVTVNNPAAGAPHVQPADGTLAAGIQPVIASFPAGTPGAVPSLAVDGAEPVTKPTLGEGVATFSFDVGSNSLDVRYHNHLLVNGRRLDLGGDYVSQRTDFAIPNEYLRPGDNVITVVTGGRQETCGVNRDDFAIANLALVVAGGTATGQNIAPSYTMGDGSCGSSTTALREVELHYTIDAPAAHVRPTLGSGLAVFAFDIGTNSMEARYHNFVLVNGMKLDLGGDHVSQRVEITVPNEWLVPGWNTIDLVTGTFPTGCGDNRDDFTVSNVTLTPAEGTATQQRRQPSYGMGDGDCGSTVNPLREIDLHFLVNAPARGIRADVDTAALPDGDHTVAAASTTGEVATRLLVTDNTAPEVTVSTPAAGQTITSAVALDVRLDDASGVLSGPDVVLDGAEVALGAPIGPGLTPGEHTLSVTGTDVMGNTAVREIVFTSAGIPDVPAELAPASGSTDVGAAATLSARVATPGGGDVTASFAQAEVSTATSAWQGTTTTMPTTLRVPGERPAQTKDLTPLDGRTLTAPTSRDIAYQRFDLRVRKNVAAPFVRWEGVVDPERLVTLHAWNPDTTAWDVVATARGAVEGNTELSATVDPRYVDRNRVNVLVTAQDPFADDIEPGDPNGFADPDTYDFSIVHFTDTQYISEGAVEQETPEERAVWASAYQGIVDWVVDNAEERKIAYAAHTGDIIENNTRPALDEPMRQQVIGEFEFSSEQQGVLDGAGIPNGVIAGNHDNQSGRETGPGALYNQYYGPDRYAAADDQWEHAEYGGPWREGDNQNHYDLFSAGGLDFVVVGLSYGVTKEEADWANSIFERFPDRNGIVLSHDYLVPSTSPDGRGAGFSAPDGAMLFRRVVEPNPNVFLVLAGHEHGVATNIKPQVGAEISRGVVELLADYQFYTVSAERLGLTEIGGYEPDDQLQFGASFFRLLQFDVDRSELIVDTYSPLLADFGATEFDTNGRYNGTEDNMVLPVDLQTRTTTFQTDAIAMYTPAEPLGSVTVPSGSVASVEWAGLLPATTYAWIVTAQSAGGGVTASAPAVFTTADTRGRPGTWGPGAPLWPYYAPFEPTDD